MGFENMPQLPDLVVDKSEVETSQVAGLERAETNLSKESFLLVPLENKEEKESSGIICYLENNKVDVPEAISPRVDILELSISSKATDDSLSLGCETPRESIFDPFAPGPEEAAWAPKKKETRGAEVPPRRKLNFDSGDYPVKRLSFDCSDSEEEEQYLQVIHKMILDLLIVDGPLDGQEETGNNVTESGLHGSFKTPDSKPLLTGIASTCPDAPFRRSLKALKLSPGICRKIDFDAVSDPASPSSSICKESNVTESGLHGSFETPDSKPLLTGIASTCPDAPLRRSLKALKLSPGICRKIDFDAVSDPASPRSSVDKIQ